MQLDLSHSRMDPAPGNSPSLCTDRFSGLDLGEREKENQPPGLKPPGLQPGGSLPPADSGQPWREERRVEDCGILGREIFLVRKSRTSLWKSHLSSARNPLNDGMLCFCAGRKASFPTQT